MAFDSDLPTPTTKIRNYPTVLTENFQALEQGQDSLQQWKANFIERNAIPSAPPVDPTRIDDNMQIFAKQNADGETDLYVLDDRGSANIIELTENGKIGGRSQDFVMNEVFFGTDAQGYGQWALPSAWGYVTSTPTLSYGYGVDSVAIQSITSTKITWDTSYITNANYIIVVTVLGENSTTSATVSGISSTEVVVSPRTAAGGNARSAFSFVVFGGR